MQLSKKKALAAKVLKVGKDKILFVKGNLPEIKEAITRQDILDLHSSGAIKIKRGAGRKKIKKRKRRRGIGKIKKRVKTRKKDYAILTRKLRGVIRSLKKSEKVDKEKYHRVRRMIRGRKFRSKRHLHESVGEI